MKRLLIIGTMSFVNMDIPDNFGAMGFPASFKMLQFLPWEEGLKDC
jgi:serine acetyltransferase